MIFPYGEKELEYLKLRDARLGEIIDRVGFIEREVNCDIFSSIVKNIIGQQISNAALKTVEGRLMALIDEITPEKIYMLGTAAMRSCGISLKKAENIFNIAEQVFTGQINLEELRGMADGEIITRLTAFRGIGRWTAEMILIFCLNRQNILSFGDFGIRRGMEILYGDEKITRAKFNEYYERYCPYATVAGFYLWAVGNGEVTPSSCIK